ncbi:MAG: DNA polymerase/3'-5' exonuclease PolX [Candidatus Eisenbacteria bacterium]|nr:DNA polymerase/3'-5' exonuclease PolX [Candidatus Eisenbacteria bacterium]
MKNRVLSELFEQMADALEFKGENRFKVNAYRKVSRVLGDLREDIEHVRKEGKLLEVPGIGKGTAEKIEEYLKTGRISKFKEVMDGVPPGIVDLLSIQGLGPKTLALAYKELGVKSVEDLVRVSKDKTLASLPGMGEKKLDNILRGIKLHAASKERISLGIALPIVEKIIDSLKKYNPTGRMSPAGSLRRMKETIGDIDILVESREGEEIIDRFTSLPDVQEVLAKGDTKGSIIVSEGLQVDIRAVPPESFGSALQYFTGSKEHNVHLREIAKKMGMKISEYGIFKGDKSIGGRAEEDIYEGLGLELMPPELREDSGEIEASGQGSLPRLLEENDIKGDLHVHSAYSDGFNTIEEVVLAGKRMGYSYLAICDHTKSAAYAGGLSEERLSKQMAEIDGLRKRISGIRILKGAEVDIKADGSLDLPDSILEKLDVVVAAIHSGFRKNVTERIVKAMRNPFVRIIAHPTGRLISKREGYDVDLERVLEEARKTGTALEINAYYDRLDLNDGNARRAKELGVKLAIGTDSHNTEQLWMMKLGVSVARRAWLEKSDVLNASSRLESRKRKSS